jgi:hypothetical protein
MPINDPLFNTTSDCGIERAADLMARRGRQKNHRIRKKFGLPALAFQKIQGATSAKTPGGQRMDRRQGAEPQNGRRNRAHHHRRKTAASFIREPIRG